MSALELIQTTTQIAQLSQLADLNAHFRAQQQAQALQANLGQALFETERMARRVALTLPQDPFAAAILSHDWLQRIQGIGPELFVAIEHKRAWSDAQDVLRSAYRKAEFDPHLNGLVGRYLQWRDIAYEQLFGLGNDPQANLAQSHHAWTLAIENQKRVEKRVTFMGVVVGILLLLWMASMPFDARVPFGFLFFIGVIAFIASRSGLSQAKTGVRRAHERHVANTERVRAFEALMEDPSTGGFVQKMWNEHPLLFNEPFPTGPTSFPETRASNIPVQTFVERQVVERQVVVTRCRFCNQMTPVDRPECQRCGAPGYGG